MYAPKTVSVIGFGRFGRLWAKLLSTEFQVLVYDPQFTKPEPPPAESYASKVNLEQALAAEVIFYCLPISAFEKALALHACSYGALLEGKLLVDTLSVKLHAQEVFNKYLPPGAQALLTHPLFGPDSAGSNNTRIVVNRFKCSVEIYQFWISYFSTKQMRIIEMDPDEHDRQAAHSQGLTHLVSRILEQYQFDETEIDTKSCRQLLQIKRSLCSDSFELFSDMQKYNPYSETVRAGYLVAQGQLFDKLSNAL